MVCESTEVCQAPLLSERKRIRIQIDGSWYDVTAFAKTHPGGEVILESLNGMDATDAFHSLHSEEAKERLSKMRPDVSDTRAPCNEPLKATLAFRKLRKELEAEGWFKRNWYWDSFYLAVIFVLAVVGTRIAHTHPILAIIAIGVAMEQAGWVGHDHGHGRGDTCWWLNRVLGGVLNGFSALWWSNKHNTHHVYPNYFGIDADIQNDPVFHLWSPEKKNDVWFRRYQHLYFLPTMSVLYISWRKQSFDYAWASKNHFELALIAVNYLWLLYLPWLVSVGAVLLAGWMVGVVVTATHQSEEITPASEKAKYCFATAQFRSTRDVDCGNFLMNFLWGGMQYQLEHHLFPTMPKYYYGALRGRLQKWSAENGLDYKISGVIEILKLNYETLRQYALAEAKSA
eukprot:TRINITY_DN6543_c0_g1_i2.p1 TRINITY_DN6543_c0_g1~~TRINITY_DN6543_c0_g1_i2.p1  ORF type:complete len:399 (+),score=87.03 TRINITY_DN6543_c0_g1_i2:106-1302(+)